MMEFDEAKTPEKLFKKNNQFTKRTYNKNIK